MASCKLPVAIALLAALAALPACTAAPEADDEEQEEEPTADTSDEALSSGISCTEKAVTGYDRGKPYAMKVVSVGAKPTAKATAHAFLRMQSAAQSAGVRLSINSGFRSMAEQQHLYDCYKSGSCNSGNLAARPGYSNHQNGRALDLATSDWSWVASHASKFGFRRTVPSERWHYEFSGADPGGPCSGASSASSSAKPDDADPQDDTDAAEPAAGTCHSETLGKDVAEGACVQAKSNELFYQCHDGKWYRGVSNGKGPFGACTSTHALE